ncbi:MAG: hypothetical protein AMXMBFR61_15830 [Fimbriimonadales bacterium]
MDYLHLLDPTVGVEPPVDGILSRTLLDDEYAKVLVFGFGAGQELSEHTASMPALLQFLQGEADLTLGKDATSAVAGTCVYMRPNLPHSVHAKTPVVMLLVLMKRPT